MGLVRKLLVNTSCTVILKQCVSCCYLRMCRCLDASNIEPLLWTATALGLERLTAGCAQYLLSRDVIAAAPAQVLHSISCCLSQDDISNTIVQSALVCVDPSSSWLLSRR